eukprot:CAMPEP_0206135100 /NCGR_PEP_ID=MMETSP1473-20131121/466_1 /ASSEMBLY_ACC=CAM_ASM_001109 /TAXON_ID=1461547 /ORGANISM="Stichococcus sp, Strain RCC1054" /LENGTH=337 /DNA_ID=CAMNT_0053526837 /DNA_START=628 /DNA_END=1641 /DNA_ORIENTATION=+
MGGGTSTSVPSPTSPSCKGTRPSKTGRRSGNSWAVLDRAGPLVTLQSLQVCPQAARSAGMPQPQLDDLPDHLLTDILTLACEPLRASAVLPAEDAAACVGKLQLRVTEVAAADAGAGGGHGGGVAVAISAAVAAQGTSAGAGPAPGLDLWRGTGPGACAAGITAGGLSVQTALLWLLAVHHVASDSSAWLVPSDLDLGLWTALEHLPEIRLVTPEDIQRLRGLPSGLKFLGLNCKWRVEGDLVLSLPHLGRVLAHLTSLRALQINGMHVAPAQLPESVQQVSLDFCTLDPAESWPSDMRVVWEAPMSSMAPRRTLLMGRRNAAGAISSEVSWEAAVD